MGEDEIEGDFAALGQDIFGGQNFLEMGFGGQGGQTSGANGSAGGATTVVGNFTLTGQPGGGGSGGGNSTTPLIAVDPLKVDTSYGTDGSAKFTGFVPVAVAMQSTGPVPFTAGTALTFVKELIRLVVVERKLRGTSHLFRGLRDGRQISRDASWQPMPPLEPAQPVA